MLSIKSVNEELHQKTIVNSCYDSFHIHVHPLTGHREVTIHALSNKPISEKLYKITNNVDSHITHFKSTYTHFTSTYTYLQATGRSLNAL